MPERSPAQAFAELYRLPPKEAVAYLSGRGQLTQTFSWQDLWQDEHASQFTVSRLARLDLLKAIQEGITQSVQGDLSRTDWTRDIKGLLKKEGWWGETEQIDPLTGDIVSTKFDAARLKLIFDTNSRMAYSAGLWQRIERNKASHPYIRYITRGDERVRESHRSWNNLTLPVDHPFWNTHFPPNGWRCRCRAMSMSAAEYQQRRAAGTIQTAAPVITMREWINPRTGEVSQVPVGIDPGFAYNPGQASARQANLQAIGHGKLAALPAPIRRAALATLVGEGVSPAFAKAVTSAHAALPQAARLALAAAGYEVKVVDKIITAAPELAGAAVPGYPAGMAFESNDGLTRIGRGQILVAEQALNLATGQWEAASAVRAAAVLRHEVGHAIDAIHEFTARPEIAAAWSADSAALLPQRAALPADAIDEFNYFTAPPPYGMLEVVAELYALRHGAGTASQIDAAVAFPRTAAALGPLWDALGV